MTSAVVKAYPPTPVTDVSLGFNYRVAAPTNGSALTPPANATSADGIYTSNNLETFWKGVWLYQRITPIVVDAGGTLYSYVRPEANNGLNFTVIIKLPLKNTAQAAEFVKPLYTALNKIGILVVANPVPNPDTVTSTSVMKTGVWSGPKNTYFGSRLLPRANWDNDTIYNQTFAAIRATADLGFTYHSVEHHAPLSLVGYPGDMNSITPAWRAAISHVTIMDTTFTGFATTTAADFRVRYARLTKAMDGLRAVTPTSGAYFNEADVQEPNWQTTFFGPNYSRLTRIKRARDPWGLFWAPTTPGSEFWKLVTQDDLPTQNGPLCQTGYEDPWDKLEGESKTGGQRV